MGKEAVEMRSTDRARRRWPWLALVALVVASTAVRVAASRGVTTPWIAPDEMEYGLLGRSLYATGTLGILHDSSGFVSALVPAVFGLPLSLGDLELGYSVLKALGALVMSLAAVPVYLWARTLVSTRWALGAAALTLALPGLAYSGLIMSEVVFYPVLTLAAWSIAATIESPTLTRQLGFCAAFAVAVLTRPQAAILVPAFLGAVALDAALARTWPRIRSYAPALAGIGLAAAGWALVTALTGGPVLGGYSGAERHYSLRHALAYVAYHAGDLVLLTGVLPVCAVGVLLASGARRGERDPRARAYLAATTALALAVVTEVGVFASGNVGHLAERDLIGLAPAFFVGFVLWLARGGTENRRAKAGTALVAVAAVAAIPLGAFVNANALVDGLSLVPLYHLRSLTSLPATTVALDAGVVATAALFVLVPRRLLLALPVLVGLVLASGSVAASRQVVSESNSQRTVVVGPIRRWIDNAATGPVAYLYDQSMPFNTVWQALFWNRRIEGVYDLPASFVAGPVPQQTLSVATDGRLETSAGGSPRPAFVVAPQPYALVGKPVAYSPRNADQSGLALWKASLPLRVSAVSFGLESNGDIDPAAGDASGGLTAYDCRGGSFRLTLLVKEAETIRIELDGRAVRRRAFPGQSLWSVTVPVDPAAAARGGICRLEVFPSALTGTTRLVFDRASNGLRGPS